MTGKELDREVRAELSGLGTFGSTLVARHLVMVDALLDTDPELAWQHALAARARGARLAVVREAAGLAAYRTGRYAEALAELRTVRRITGSTEHLPVMADCERGLGRPERAIALATSAEADALPIDRRIEMQIVASGARADLGQVAAAVLAVQLPELESRTAAAWLPRLRAAYASALAAAGRREEADAWAARAGRWWSDDLDHDHSFDQQLDAATIIDLADDERSPR